MSCSTGQCSLGQRGYLSPGGGQMAVRDLLGALWSGDGDGDTFDEAVVTATVMLVMMVATVVT